MWKLQGKHFQPLKPVFSTLTNRCQPDLMSRSYVEFKAKLFTHKKNNFEKAYL